jgi:hypothetical protein
MKKAAAAVVMVLASTMSAQAEMRVALGASVNLMKPSESALGGTRTTVSPTLGVAPTKGIGFTYGLSWFEQRLPLEDIGGPLAEGELHIRPVMLGAGYTFGSERTLISVSAVGGYSINTLKIDDDTRRGPGEIEISHSPVVRPGIRLWRTLHEHFGVSVFGGYVITRPKLTIDGTERTLKADYAVFSVGGAYVF